MSRPATGPKTRQRACPCPTLRFFLSLTPLFLVFPLSKSHANQRYYMPLYFTFFPPKSYNLCYNARREVRTYRVRDRLRVKAASARRLRRSAAGRAGKRGCRTENGEDRKHSGGPGGDFSRKRWNWDLRTTQRSVGVLECWGDGQIEPPTTPPPSPPRTRGARATATLLCYR